MELQAPISAAAGTHSEPTPQASVADRDVTAVPVLAGLLEPCGNIGTEGRYCLLVEPCSTDQLHQRVMDTINTDLLWRDLMLAYLEDEAKLQFPAVDPLPRSALVRGIGLRVWRCQGASIPTLLPLARWLAGHQPTISNRQWRAAAALIDELSEGFGRHQCLTLPLDLNSFGAPNALARIEALVKVLPACVTPAILNQAAHSGGRPARLRPNHKVVSKWTLP